MKKPKIIGLNTTFVSLNYPGWVETCFSESTSLLDYEAVVINPAELLREYGYKAATYRNYPILTESYSEKIAKDFRRVENQLIEMLRSGRNIFVVLNSPDIFWVRESSARYRIFDSYSFLPIKILTENLTGSELCACSEEPYNLYFKKNKDILFYDCVIERLPDAIPLAQIQGTSKLVSAYVHYANGKIIFLPPVVLEGKRKDRNVWETNGKRFIESIFEFQNALSVPNEINALPEWTEDFRILNESDAIEETKQVESQIEELKKKLSEKQANLEQIINYKRLLTETGTPLENIVKQVLCELGFELCPVEEKRTDIIAKYGDTDIVVEIKGVSKSAAEKHAAQLEKWAAEFLEKHDHQPKALLIVNGYNTMPLDKRTEEVFPDQMLKYCKSREQALITTTQLLCLFIEVKKNPDCKEERIQELLSTIGRYSRYVDHTKFITK